MASTPRPPSDRPFMDVLASSSSSSNALTLACASLKSAPALVAASDARANSRWTFFAPSLSFSKPGLFWMALMASSRCFACCVSACCASRVASTLLRADSMLAGSLL